MKRGGAAAALGLLLLWSSPAFAWDTFLEEGRSEPPVLEAAPDLAPLIATPPGLYYVTDTYVQDVVTSSGPLTTYSTATVHESTGSYARVLDTVPTGASSAFDGSAFNGRAALTDGRSVAGTYYENFVFADGAFVPISIVFFQDDAELARHQATTKPPVTTVPSPAARPSTPRPLVSACCAAERPVLIAVPPAPTKPVRPVISILPVSIPLTMVEVLRGRAVTLWPRAFADGREVPVRSWTVVAGQAGDALATAGSGGVPFRSSWSRLAPPGGAYEVVFRIEVDTPETGHRTVDGAITVVVRSPALQD